MLHFGTDGVRGVAIDELTPALARDLARAVARVLQPTAVVVGRDTRESGPALEQAIIDGCAAEGVTVHQMGVAPTPAIAFAAEHHQWVAIAITASHNPWTDNGIKVFAAGGSKLSDNEQIDIERQWHALVAEPAPVALGTVHDASHIVDEYVQHRLNTVGGAFAGIRIVLDCQWCNEFCSTRVVYLHGCRCCGDECRAEWPQHQRQVRSNIDCWVSCSRDC